MSDERACCRAHLTSIPFVSTPTVCPTCDVGWAVAGGEWVAHGVTPGPIPGWEVATCPICNQSGVRVGRPSVGFLGATPIDPPQRFPLDVPKQCEDCLHRLGLNRRNYGVPGAERDLGMVDAIEASLPALKRKRDERWNYVADHGGLDPTNFEPMQKRLI